MRPEPTFVAERIAAQHCPELLRAGLSPSEMLPMLEQFGSKLARVLGPALVSMLGGKVQAARTNGAQTKDAAQLTQAVAPLAANCLLALGRQDTPMLLSLEAGAVLNIVDRMFGGKGELSKQLPKEFPLSAEMVIGRLEGLIASQIAEALGLGGEETVRMVRRHGSLEELAPFQPACQLATIEIVVTNQHGETMGVLLALPVDRLADVFGHGERPATAQRGPVNPMNEPFGDMELPVRALLVDMQTSMSVLANLQPGQILPVAVARKVPLRIGDKTIAEGTVGEIDDRVALQITRAF